MLTTNKSLPSKNDSGTIAFQDLVTIMRRAKPTFSRPIKGLGKRVFIPYVFEFGGKIAEFFCEATIVAERPSQPELGYTFADVGYFRGVTVFEKREMDAKDRPKKGKPSGEVLSFGSFLDKYVEDPATRSYLSLKMEELFDAVQLDDENLENINDMWAARDIGEKILNIRLH